MIPKEAIEEAAKHIYNITRFTHPHIREWEDTAESVREVWRLEATRLLKEVAPILMAQAWDEGAAKCADAIWDHETLIPNPYRAATK